MNGRERTIAAIDGEEPDLVPITDRGFDPLLVERIVGRPTKRSPARTEWESSRDHLLDSILAYDTLGFDAVVLRGSGLLSYRTASRPIGHYGAIDEWGRIFQFMNDTKTDWWIGGTVKTPEDLDRYEPPDPDEPGRYEMLESAVRNIDDDKALIGSFTTGSTFTWQVMGGVDKLIVAMHRDGSFVSRLRDKIFSVCMRWIKMMLDAGFDAFFISDDYADNHGPFLGPKIFRDFELPYFRQGVDAIRRRGLPVLQHSDGNLLPILEDLIDAGIAGLHPIEPGVMDLADIKLRYGDRICLMGNVDCGHVLQSGTEADVVAEVRRVIEAASHGGGHILTSSCSLDSSVKSENVSVMTAEARRYGRYSKTHV